MSSLIFIFIFSVRYYFILFYFILFFFFLRTIRFICLTQLSAYKYSSKLQNSAPYWIITGNIYNTRERYTTFRAFAGIEPTILLSAEKLRSSVLDTGPRGPVFPLERFCFPWGTVVNIVAIWQLKVCLYT